MASNPSLSAVRSRRRRWRAAGLAALAGLAPALAGLPADAQQSRSRGAVPSIEQTGPQPGPSFTISPAPSLPAHPKTPVEAASLAASDWAANDHARVRLIAAASATGKGEKAAVLPLGLEFRLAPDWKIYWRSPGDAGYAPRVDWTGSTNLAKATFAWPVPERYGIFGLTTYVYRDAVVLPLDVVPERPGEPVSLRAKVDYLLCDKICIPYEAVLALDLPAGEGTATEHVATLKAAAARVPRVVAHDDAKTAAFAVRHATLTQERDGLTLDVLAAATETPFVKPDAIVEGPRGMAFGAPEVTLSDGGRLALLRLPVDVAGQTGAPPDAALTVTLVDGARAIEQDVMAAVSAPRAALEFAGILALALLGGLILNLMPCVLPVLSLKLMGAVRHAGRPSREVRASFLAVAAGILAAFLALAAGAIALKSAGLAVGWGIQFQQPAFLAAMALVLTLFACSLWGLFHIRLPGGVTTAAAGQGRGLLGDFAAGAFATLLATPCSAPFLGTAIGFALTRGPGEILAVFAALGLGLALPYLLVAAVPALARLLPRPGPWMAWLSRILGFALAATVVWLLSVLATQTGVATALLAGAGLAALVGALALRARGRDGSLLRRAGWPLAGACGALVVAVALSAAPHVGRATAVEIDMAWRPFDRVQVINAVATGQVVLVDVTADWCVTCQANKRLVLDRGAVREAIAKGELLGLRADWTRPDPAISDYLAGFGRYGIPFNAVYGPAAPGGIALSELLSEAEVMAAVKKAAGAAR